MFVLLFKIYLFYFVKVIYPVTFGQFFYFLVISINKLFPIFIISQILLFNLNILSFLYFQHFIYVIIEVYIRAKLVWDHFVYLVLVLGYNCGTALHWYYWLKRGHALGEEGVVKRVIVSPAPTRLYIIRLKLQLIHLYLQLPLQLSRIHGIIITFLHYNIWIIIWK